MNLSSRRASLLSRYGSLVVLTVLLSGCASIETPPGTISEKAKQDLDATFTASIRSINDAMSSQQGVAADPNLVANFVGAGMALSDIRCKDYFKRLGQAAQQYAFGRKELGLASGTVAGLQGLTGVSAKVVAITASMFSFGIASTENYADAFLFSPEISGVQQLVESAQNAYRVATPPLEGMKYPEALTHLRTYDQLCEVQTIRRLVNESISTAQPVAAKAESIVTTAERYVLAREVGVPALTTNQVAYIYWYLMGSPSAEDAKIIEQGLAGIELFVGTDGKLKRPPTADETRIKRALATVIDRNEERLNELIAQLRTPGATTRSGSGGTPESTPSSAGLPARPLGGGGISIRIRH